MMEEVRTELLRGLNERLLFMGARLDMLGYSSHTVDMLMHQYVVKGRAAIRAADQLPEIAAEYRKYIQHLCVCMETVLAVHGEEPSPYDFGDDDDE